MVSLVGQISKLCYIQLVTKLTLSQRGLTLFEILIAVILIMMLALASYLGFNVSLAKGRDSVRKADLEKIKGALYDYFMDTNCFPEQLPECGGELKSGNVIYYDNFPCGPNGESYFYQTDEGDCNDWFKVLTKLENKRDTSIKKSGCNYGCGPDCDYNYGVSSSNIRVNEGCVTFYACTPSGQCEAFEDPQASQCPQVFENEPDCRNLCDDRTYRCHDERGKQIPDE